MDRPIACVALKCADVKDHPVEWCESDAKRCPFAHQRRREQDRAEREEKDRLRREPRAPVNPEGVAP